MIHSNSRPDSITLCGIDRARWPAELASRNVNRCPNWALMQFWCSRADGELICADRSDFSRTLSPIDPIPMCGLRLASRVQRLRCILAQTKEFRDPGQVPTPVRRPGSRAAGSPPRAGCTFFVAIFTLAADKNFQSRLLRPRRSRLSERSGRDGSGVESTLHRRMSFSASKEKPSGRRQEFSKPPATAQTFALVGAKRKRWKRS
jgi:hypothetical protein